MTPPEDVTDPAMTIIGWTLWIIAALGVGRLMFVGGKWGFAKHANEGFEHSTTEIILVLVGTILASTAALWVTALRGG